MILSGFRVELICAVISVVMIVAGPGESKPRYKSPLKNKYVEVTLVQTPPLVDYDCAWNTSRPAVQIYDPARKERPAQGELESSNSDKIRVKYVLPWEIAGCYQAEEGTFIGVYLKAKPSKSPFSDDAVKADPAHNEVLMENDRVRVVRVHFASGETGPIVNKRPRVIFARTDSHASVTFPDGHSEPRDMKAGTVSFGNPGRQATKNTGTTQIENIVVELKSKDSEKK